MRNVERRQVTAGEFGEVVLEQIRRAGARQTTDQEIVQRAGPDGHVELDVAIPFRVTVKVAPESTEGRRARPEPCCVCLDEGGRVTCLGTCCRG